MMEQIQKIQDDPVDHDTKIAIAKMAVAAGGTVTSWLTLNEWVAVVTLVFVCCQILLLLPKIYTMFSGWFHKTKHNKRSK